jgi:hypothetical protein
MLRQGGQSEPHAEGVFPVESANVFVGTTNSVLQLRLAPDSQMPGNAEYRRSAERTEAIPVNELAWERVVDFLKCGNYEGGNRAAEA